RTRSPIHLNSGEFSYHKTNGRVGPKTERTYCHFFWTEKPFLLRIIRVKKRIVILVLKYGLGLGLLAWVVWRYWVITTPEGEDVGIGAALEKPIHVVPFLVAGLFCLTSLLLTFLRWFILVRAQDLPFTVPNAVRLGLIGYYLNTFLP